MYLGGGKGSRTKGKGAAANTLARHPRTSKGKAVASRPKGGPKRKPSTQWPFREVGFSNPPANLRGCL